MVNYLIILYFLVSIVLFIYITVKSKKSYHEKRSLGVVIEYSTLWPFYVVIEVSLFLAEKYRKFIGMSEER